jgi:hypothetical protein
MPPNSPETMQQPSRPPFCLLGNTASANDDLLGKGTLVSLLPELEDGFTMIMGTVG